MISHIGSFLTGKKGTYKMQEKQLREELSRHFNGNGVGGSRNTKNKRSARKTRKH
jgi:hypothetical protein